MEESTSAIAHLLPFLREEVPLRKPPKVPNISPKRFEKIAPKVVSLRLSSQKSSSKVLHRATQ
jgi:hypothetical protein